MGPLGAISLVRKRSIMMIFNLDYVLVDPYEKDLVYVGSSKVEGAGRGVFAKKALKKGTIVSFVNGIKMDFLESKIRGEDKNSQYSIDNDWSVPKQSIDIPPKYRWYQKLLYLRFLDKAQLI